MNRMSPNAESLSLRSMGNLFDPAGDVMVHRIRVSYEASAARHTGGQVLESILANLG